MKPPRLSVKELAAFIGVSTDTIRRAYRKGEIPAIRVKTALKFDLDEVRKCLQRNAEARFGTRSASARGGASAGRAQDDQPPVGNTGATRGHYPQRSLQEVQGFHELTVHPHH